jgi:hypothetical protein
MRPARSRSGRVRRLAPPANVLEAAKALGALAVVARAIGGDVAFGVWRAAPDPMSRWSATVEADRRQAGGAGDLEDGVEGPGAAATPEAGDGHGPA